MTIPNPIDPHVVKSGKTYNQIMREVADLIGIPEVEGYVIIAVTPGPTLVCACGAPDCPGTAHAQCVRIGHNLGTLEMLADVVREALALAACQWDEMAS